MFEPDDLIYNTTYCHVLRNFWDHKIKFLISTFFKF